jgi:uncharacterized membrane protein
MKKEVAMIVGASVGAGLMDL